MELVLIGLPYCLLAGAGVYINYLHRRHAKEEAAWESQVVALVVRKEKLSEELRRRDKYARSLEQKIVGGYDSPGVSNLLNGLLQRDSD